MKACDWDPKEFANVTGVTLGFAKLVKDNGGYSTLFNLEAKLEMKFNINEKSNQESLILIETAFNKDLIKFYI